MNLVYGTAGFRLESSKIRKIAFQVGMFGAVRSASLGGNPIGIMVTASHNPEQDNGIKFIDSTGELLSADWEPLVTEMVNKPAAQVEEFVRCRYKFHPSIVVIGRDTRPSGADIVKGISAGCQALDGTVYDLGMVATPQLHFLVSRFGESPNPQAYVSHLYEAFLSFVGQVCHTKLVVDAGNGVGSFLLDAFKPLVPGLDVVNKGEGILNFKCGADHVKTTQTPPENVVVECRQRYASLDGDADRLVYYSNFGDGFRLFDGDKISALIAKFVLGLLNHLGIRDQVSLGVVQTAYSNGNSTHYLQDLGIDVEMVRTGVKHLHQKAKQFDIGIYFEANGHGTILFNPSKLKWIDELEIDNNKNIYRQRLGGLANLASQVIGDALADLLIVEGILMIEKMSLEDWDGLYSELPNRLVNIQVPDPQEFRTGETEYVLESPTSVQHEINLQVSQVRRGRCFVRPSGTEKVVRIYAEAATRAECDRLIQKVSAIVQRWSLESTSICPMSSKEEL